jgi:hypothetical protein
MPDDNLMDVLTRRKPAPAREPGEQSQSDLTLPDLSLPYEAFAKPANRLLYSLHCVLGKVGYRSFQYMQLDSDSSFDVDAGGQIIRLRFCGSKITAVTIRGRNLSNLYDYVHQHRTAWVRRVDGGRDFGNDRTAVITAIDIEEVKEVDGGQV